MVMDALRGYVQLASGLTEVTKQRAQQAAKALLHQTGAEALTTNLTTKVSDLADEIVATSKSNRQLLQAIVSNEVEGAVARLGFVRAEEVAALTRRLERMERDLAEAREAAAPTAPAAPAASAPAGPVGDELDDDWNEPVADAGPVAPVKKAAAKKAAKTAPAKKAAKKAAAKQAAAKKVPAKKAAKKAAAKKA